MTHRLAVLISGSGTNLQALIDAIEAGTLPARIVCVLSNRPDAGGLERARQHGLDTLEINHRDYPSREAFDQAMIAALDPFAPDTLVLAGFMRILTPAFVQHYAGRLLNIHPSLLPRYPGLNTHQRALEAGDPEHGCSIHFVTDELDGGPLIAQARIPVQANDTPATLSKRVQASEHLLYPQVLAWRAEGRLRLTDHGVELDGQTLSEQGYQWHHPDFAERPAGAERQR